MKVSDCPDLRVNLIQTMHKNVGCVNGTHPVIIEFLAPTGAQGVKMSVRPCVRYIMLNKSNLRVIQGAIQGVIQE